MISKEHLVKKINQAQNWMQQYCFAECRALCMKHMAFELCLYLIRGLLMNLYEITLRN